MKQLLFVLIAVCTVCLGYSQNPASGQRSELNASLYPFYHGVASGDPLADRVILWTRITLDPVIDPVSVSWQIATDTSFNNIVNNGNATTDSTRDYTIKVDVTGLQANTWYYYRFMYDTIRSMIGRTHTLPTGTVNNIRFAVASCQDYQKGFYNAHRHLAQRNDIDYVLFLGDYTYEGGLDSVVDGRYHEPTHKTIELFEYRMRQSQYKLDADLQESHRQYPWITVWDDHETANNAYRDGAKNHTTASDGEWYDRKLNGVKVYEEWMPVRMPDPNDTFRIFRQFNFGTLLDLNMIDTRLYDRDKQAALTLTAVTDSVIKDTSRTMLGPVQLNWLNNKLDSSTAQWQIIGQQVMMAPLVIPGGVFGPDSTILNPDQWDGYSFDRQKLYEHILNNNIQNVVILTGDIHTAWANDLPLHGYDTAHRQNSIGVEFVATSISSSNTLPPLVSEPVVYGLAPYVRYVNLMLHGYYVLDISTTRTQADFVYVSDVKSRNYSIVQGPSWYANSGERFLRGAASAAPVVNSYPALAPGAGLNTALQKLTDNVTTIAIHPNPFYNQVLVQFNTWTPEEITLEVWSGDGRLMMKNYLGMSNQGLNYAQFDGSKLPSGFYVVKLHGKSASKGETIIKIN